MKKVILVSVLLVNAAISGEYHVNKDKENMVKFISDAPIENFEGVTDQIDGYLYWEDGEYTKNSELYLEVDLNSLDTGIGLRNRHMRENYLETDKYPRTYFKGKITDSRQVDDSSHVVTADGSIFIHGVEQPLKVEGKMIKIDSGFRIQTNFIVKLTDFKVEVPSIMFYKIDENMDMHLDFYVKEVKE